MVSYCSVLTTNHSSLMYLFTLAVGCCYPDPINIGQCLCTGIDIDDPDNAGSCCVEDPDSPGTCCRFT